MGAVAPGTQATDGSTVTLVKATHVGAPSGANAIGTRALRIETNGGLFGNNPSLRMAYNAVDNLGPYADQPNLFIGQSNALTGPWTARSVASGAGPLAATGNRTTATVAPGPIASGDEYFAWYSTYPICAAPPAANSVTGPGTACAGVNFTLGLANAYAEAGIEYQWESADDAAFTVNLTALGTGATQVTNQSSAKYYRCTITCSTTNDETIATELFVDMATGVCQCGTYPVTGVIATNPADEDITVCTVGTMSNPTVCNTLAPGAGSIASLYSNFTGIVAGPVAEQGSTVPFSVGQGTLCGGTWGNGVKIYVDWNQDSDWLDAGEEVFAQTTAISGVNVQTGSFVVPLTATPGITRMRVVLVETTFPNATNYAHTTYTWGETEDYCFTVTVPVPCDAPPAVNTALSTLSSACANTNFTLTLQDVVSGSGITYQWQSADDAGFTTNVQALGTGTSQVAALTTASQYYRCVLTCNNPGGGPTPSNPVLVSLTTDLCVCGTYPVTGVIATDPADEDITVCTIGTMTNNTACNVLAPGAGSIASRYSNFTGAVAGPVAGQGTSVPFSVGQGTLCGGTWGNGVKIYVDWNQDNDWLDAGEEVFSQAAAASGVNVQTGSFTVPLTATLGVTRMRVVVVETTFPNATNYAHTSYTWGETEDYCFTVQPPPSPAEATVDIIDNCIGGTYTIEVDVTSFGSGGSANIEYSVNAGPPVIVPAVIGINTIPTSGSFLQATDNVTITVTNGTIADLDLGTFFGNCPITITCDTPPTEIPHCYGNNDPRVFVFIASDPLRTLTMTFIAGTMDPNDIIRTYAGTDENTSPFLVSGSFSDLGAPQLVIESINDTLMLVIDSDGSNSCQDNQQTSWQFEVICTQPCVNPAGTATYDICTSTIDVSLDFDGSGNSARIGYILNANDTVFISGLNAPYLENLGPFAVGDVVKVLLQNEDDLECVANLGTTTILAIPAPPLVIASADPTEICPGGSTQLQATAVSATPPAVPAYAFEQFVGTYTPISGGVSFGNTATDDSYFTNPASPLTSAVTGPGTPIGFNFTFNGTVYDRIGVQSNGWISFGSSSLTPSVAMNTTSAYTPLASTAINTPAHLRNRVAAFGADLQAQAGASIRVQTLGSSPNQVCVIQWENYKDFGVTGHNLNFQIRLHEGTNFVEVHYGTMVWTATANTAHVGLGGSAAAQFNNRTTTTNWNSTTAGALNTASCTWTTAAAYPTVGRVFRWRSPEIAGASYSWTPADDLDNAFISNPLASGVAATTNFTVTATGTAFPCPGSTDVLVTVGDPLTTASITPGTASYCTGGSVLLTANAGDGVAPFTYQWYDPSNNTMGTAQTQSANIVGDWTCLVTDDCGASFLATATVSSIETPVVNVTPDQPTCAGYDIVLTANTVSGTPTSWLWSGPAPIGGQTTQSVTLNDITTANNGIYSVVATFSGCPSAPAAYTLTANPSPTITSFGAQPITVCPGDNSVLSVTASLPAPATYCIPAMSTGCTFPDIVENVTFAGINRTSACDAPTAPLGYSNFNTPQGNVVAGGTYPISVTTNGDDENLSVWIDYNRDGVFAATERVLERLAVTPEPQTTAGNVTIPLTAFNGPTRMRVRCIYGTTYAQVDPCVAVTFGEVEDYVINITGGVEQIVYAWTGGSFLGGIDNTPTVTANNIAATTTYNILVSSLGCTDTEDITVYYGTNEVTLEVQTDANGDDISYEFRQEGTNTLMYYVGPNTLPNNAVVTNLNCLPDGCYYLVVMDAGGDGIVGGGYVLREGDGALRRIIDNRRDIFGNGGFTSGSVSQIAANEGFCLPLSDDRLIYTSCDKLDWKVSPCGGEFVVANENTDVSAEYGYNNANSGYQMWWYAPNGGYSFKRFQSHNTTNGLPASATRACHFQLNAWLGNQLQQNTLYNVKVRGRINGVYNNWGPACRLIVDDVLAQCPRTKLMDLPSNQYLSCGQTRTIGTTSLVHARNVRRMNANCNWVNANRYQFRFRLPAENVVILKTSATGQYWVNTNGLACNKTYEVDVRASFNNGSTWCVVTPNPNTVSDPLWGDMCLLTTTCSFGMAEEEASTATEARMAMYPNPNRGDQLMLNVSSVEEGVETVTVDIFDAYGKRAIARTIAVQDGFVNTVIDLDGALANGLYMVSITAGSTAYNERLVIQK